MSPNKRQIKIFDLLNSADEWITANEISTKFNVSERTIYNDLTFLNEKLKSTTLKIEKKRGVGLKLVNEVENDKDMKSDLVLFESRTIKILKKFLFDNKILTLQSLSEEFFVSVSSIQQDLKKINKLLVQNTKSFIESSRRGYRLIKPTNETTIRKTFEWFNQYVLDRYTFGNKSQIETHKEVFYQYYEKKIVDVAFESLYKFIIENKLLLSDYYISNILNIYIVQLYRISIGKIVSAYELNENKESNIDIRKYTMGANTLLKEASTLLHFEIKKMEVNYLTKYLVLNRIENVPPEEYNQKIIDDLIHQISEVLEIDLSKDKQLIKELSYHVPPMIYRLKLGINTDNPYIKQIIDQFGQTFLTIKLVLDDYEKKLGISFNNEEIALLTIYFQSALERKDTSKILVICQHGVAVSELLVNRLMNYLPHNTKIQSSSATELENHNLSDYDIVLSTIDGIKGENIIKISTFLKVSDIEKIQNIINKNISRGDNRVTFEAIKKYLNKTYIYLNSEFNCKKNLLNYVLDELILDEIVEQNYKNSVLQREEKGNTDFPSGVAIPHGDSTYVNKTVIVVIENSLPIKWDDYDVNTILIPVISYSDKKVMSNIVKEIYHIIENSDIRKKFIDYLSMMGAD